MNAVQYEQIKYKLVILVGKVNKTALHFTGYGVAVFSTFPHTELVIANSSIALRIASEFYSAFSSYGLKNIHFKHLSWGNTALCCGQQAVCELQVGQFRCRSSEQLSKSILHVKYDYAGRSLHCRLTLTAPCLLKGEKCTIKTRGEPEV